jgi:NADH-quinone oxidoreductase subunit C
VSEPATLTNERVYNRIKERLGDNVGNAFEPYGMLTMHVKREHIIEALKFLRDDEELQFVFLTTLCGVHYPNDTEKFEVIYHLHSFVNNVRVRLKVRIHGEPPHIPSAVKVFPAANWMERETYDFYGIHFDGHPNLKRILNVDDMTIFPMRKNIRLKTIRESIRTMKCLEDKE